MSGLLEGSRSDGGCEPLVDLRGGLLDDGWEGLRRCDFDGLCERPRDPVLCTSLADACR